MICGKLGGYREGGDVSVAKKPKGKGKGKPKQPKPAY